MMIYGQPFAYQIFNKLQRKRDEMMRELEDQQQQIAQLEKELTRKLSLRQ